MSTPLTEQLKPCPFCGKQPISADVSGTDATGESYGYWVIECWKCNSQQYAERFCGVHGDEEKDAITAWNTRAETDTERKLAAAREALAFALAKEESDMSDAEQCGGWDDVDWLNAHARANRYRAALASLEKSSPQTTEKPNHQ